MVRKSSSWAGRRTPSPTRSKHAAMAVLCWVVYMLFCTFALRKVQTSDDTQLIFLEYSLTMGGGLNSAPTINNAIWSVLVQSFYTILEIYLNEEPMKKTAFIFWPGGAPLNLPTLSRSIMTFRLLAKSWFGMSIFQIALKL